MSNELSKYVVGYCDHTSDVSNISDHLSELPITSIDTFH